MSGWWRWVVFAVVGVGADDAAAEQERVLYSKLQPTSVRWGEVAFRFGDGVEVGYRRRGGNDPVAEEGQLIRFRESARIEFTIRERVEEVQGIVSKDEWIGTVTLGANVEPQQQWREWRERIQQAVRTVPPEGYREWLEHVENTLTIGTEGSIDLVYCVERPDAEPRAGEAERRHDEQGERSGSARLSDSKRYCRPLLARLGAGPPDQLVASSFEVASAVQTQIALAREVRRLSSPSGELPGAASIERLAPEQDATGFKSWSSGASWNEGKEQRRASRDDPAWGTKRGDEYIVRSVAPEVSIPAAQTQTAAVFWRVEIRPKELRYGSDPTVREPGDEAIDVALFLTRPDQVVGSEQIFDSLAESLDSNPGPLSAEEVQSLLQKAIQRHGPEAAFAAICSAPAVREGRATYCLPTACNQVTNAREICREIQKVLDR